MLYSHFKKPFINYCQMFKSCKWTQNPKMNSKSLGIFFMPCKSHILFFKTLYPPLDTLAKLEENDDRCGHVIRFKEEDPETDVFCLFSSQQQQHSGLSLHVITAAWLSGIMIFQTLMGRSLGFGLQIFRTALRRPTQQMESSTTSSKDR